MRPEQNWLLSCCAAELELRVAPAQNEMADVTRDTTAPGASEIVLGCVWPTAAAVCSIPFDYIICCGRPDCRHRSGRSDSRIDVTLALSVVNRFSWSRSMEALQLYSSGSYEYCHFSEMSTIAGVYSKHTICIRASAGHAVLTLPCSFSRSMISPGTFS